MKTGVAHLCIPGPGVLPESVRRAMNVPMEDHRAPDFGALTLSILSDLKLVFRTRAGEVLLFPGSGTTACEAAIVNTLAPGDRVLMARHGQFSTVWAQMAERLGLMVEAIDLPWGAGTPVTEIGRRLADDVEGRIKAVFVTHNETATGVTSDVAAVRAVMDAAYHEALLFVDGVSSIGSIDFRMDDWGVDLAVAGSQKGLMAPAGLGILAASPRALAAARSGGMPRACFRFEDMLRMNAEGCFPYAPATPLLHGLRAALDRLLAEGLDAVIARHARLAEGVRQGVFAWGLDLVAEHPSLWSNTVTAIRAPRGVDARDVIALACANYNTSFGTGLGPLAGKAFRIGHLGDLNEVSCLAALGAAEMALADAGAAVEPGSGVAAAQRVYRAARFERAFALAAE